MGLGDIIMKCVYEKNRNKRLTTNDLVDILYNSKKDGKRHCFILGAGASVESNIPSGIELERKWISEMIMAGKSENEIPKPTSENYFKIFEMRFKTQQEGNRELESILEKAQLSKGYETFARLLCETNNNLVISTNFDSLVEKAVHKRSNLDNIRVLSHEALIQYIDSSLNIYRPTIAKIHRDVYLSPLNSSEDVNHLPKEWEPFLHNVFKEFTPIMIGYAGGDHSLMDFLKKESSNIKEVYWCVLPNSEINQRVRILLNKTNRHLVEIKGFEDLMRNIALKFNYNIIPTYNSSPVRRSKKFISVDIDKFFNKGIDYLLDYNAEEAVNCFNTIITIQPNPNDANLIYFNRGNAYAALHLYKKAIADFEKCLVLSPSDGQVYFLMAQAYFNSREYNSALDNCNKAIENHYEELIVYSLRGSIYCKLGLYNKSLLDLDRVLNSTPDMSLDKHSLIYAYKLHGYINGFYKRNYDICLKDLLYILEYDNTDTNILNNIGCAYLEIGECEKAVYYLEQCLKIDPSYEDALKNLKKAKDMQINNIL